MIDSHRIYDIFTDCLFKLDELKDGKVKDQSQLVEAEGLLSFFGFHKDRLSGYRDEVIEALEQLPDEFHKNDGGGWSFLNMCKTKDEQFWGEHQNMEQLLALAIGLDLAGYCSPRKSWTSLPNGMPFIWIDLPEKEGVYTCKN